MITFELDKQSYAIDDDFVVIGGKYKKQIQEDIDLFFAGFTPHSGDPVLLYRDRLVDIFKADIKDFESIKEPFGTVDCSDYIEEQKMAKDSLWSKIKSIVFDNKVDRNGREHDEKGLFAALSKKSKDILGEEFIGYKGKDAIDKLMIEKRGYIIDAFHRNDIGGIALIWGDEERGLNHIIIRRKKLNHPLGKLLSSLPEVIEKGTLIEEDGDFSIIYKGKRVVIEPKLFNDKFQFLMTAYYEGIKSPQRGVY